MKKFILAIGLVLILSVPALASEYLYILGNRNVYVHKTVDVTDKKVIVDCQKCNITLTEKVSCVIAADLKEKENAKRRIALRHQKMEKRSLTVASK